MNISRFEPKSLKNIHISTVCSGSLRVKSAFQADYYLWKVPILQYSTDGTEKTS